ncbi:aspartyl-phosphate phosphatase Spo0E family protein [Proteinivorax tanatarense]|uniref:Aspartyl-phosphate phosphatase Spo0E family protein n=1 Tax=Proteinivorax tanatarense TaxID=1260629 RepID=A0AAU7VR90_9FIRM
MTHFGKERVDLIKEIEELRKLLNKSYKSNTKLDNQHIIKLSMEMDNKINRLMQLKGKKGG